MQNRMVVITSMVNARVSVKDITYGINRRWDRKGQKIPVPYEVVEGLLWQDGFRHLIDSGILYIESMQDKIDLGLEPADAKQPVNIVVLNDTKMKNLLCNVPLIVFKREVGELSKVQINNLIDYAIDNKIMNMDKCKFLKELTGRDIISAIQAREEDEEEARQPQRVAGRR